MSHDTPTPTRVQQLLSNIAAAFGILRQYPILLPLALITLIGEMNYSGINNISLPAYIRSQQLAGAEEGRVIGWIVSAFLISEMIFRIPVGWLSDRYGRSRIIIGALTLSMPSFLLGSQAPNYIWLIPLRLWDGIMAAAIFTTVYAIIGDAVPERSRANAMGVINTMYMLGLFLGFGVAGGIDHLTGNPRLFLLVSAVAVVVAALFASAFFRERPQLQTPHPDVRLEEMEKAAVAVSRHVVLLLVTFAQNFALTMVAPFMYLYLTGSVKDGGLGLGLGELVLLLGLPVLGVAAFAVPLSRVADMIGKLAAVRIAFTTVAATLWIFSVTREIWLLSLVAMVVGVAFSMGVPAWLAILSSLAGSKTRGVTLGGYGAVQGLASVLGPIVAGEFLWDRTGHASIFLGSSLVVAIAALLTWVAMPDGRKNCRNLPSVV